MNQIIPKLDQASKRGPAAASAADASGPRLKAGQKQGGEGSLGTHANFVYTSPAAAAAGAAFDPMAARVQRFALQSVARDILYSPDPQHRFRIETCLRARAFNQSVNVWKSEVFGTAHYSGLQTCGSVSACPVCAAKIGERRRAEVLSAMTVHESRGGNVHLLTLTAPHQRGDVLADLLAQQSKALKRFWMDRKVKAVMAEMGYIGQIRAWEVTHGRKAARNNGWHPHFHILLFTGMGVDLARFDNAQRRDWAVRLYLVWAKACEGAGLGIPSFEHGLKLDDGSKASAYVTKWGLEDELIKGYSKKGRDGNETPFDFLRAVLADKSDTQAAELFREFARAFKGKQQLGWSNGLKALLAVEEVSDGELAQRVEEEAVWLGQLTVDQWRDVLKVDGRSIVLELAARSGWEAVTRYLDIIKGAYQGVQLDRDVLAEAREILLQWAG